MRRSLGIIIAGVIVCAGVIGLAVQTANAGAAQQALVPPGGTQQRYGIVRYDTAAHHWAILSTPLFQASGLTGVACTAAGTLVVRFDPLATIGTFVVDEDESYAGRYVAGASMAAGAMTITIRRAGTGAVVPCGAAELRIANSSLQVLIVASVVEPTFQPTDQPSTIWPTRPTIQPSTIGPTQPTIQPSTIAPPAPSSEPPIIS